MFLWGFDEDRSHVYGVNQNSYLFANADNFNIVKTIHYNQTPILFHLEFIVR
jgi:hypothetical protein